MTTKIIIVRHGETAWNVENRFRGSQDIPLNETGIAQAKAVSKRLASEEIAAVYSSRLRRALHTAEIIAAPHGLTPVASDGLSNINYGELEGRLVSDIAQQLPEFYRALMQTPHLVRFPGGDTLDALTSRSIASLHAMIAQHPDETIVAVSHQVVTRVLICALLGLDNSHHWEISQDTCCLNVFRYKKGRFIVDKINDTCHLLFPNWREA